MSDPVSDLILGAASQPEASSAPAYTLPEVQRMIYGQESRSGQTDTSKPNYAGARGPMQILPSTFDGLKKQGFIPKDYDINNPVHNKAAGDALIADAYKRYKGDADKVLAEYYAGGKAIDGDKIHTEYRDLKNPNAPTVGEYIQQGKGRIGDDVSRLIMGAADASEPTDQTQTTQNQTAPSVSDIGLMSGGKGKVTDGIKPVNAMATIQSARQYNEPLAGVGEALLSNIYNPLVSTAGTIKGVLQSIPEAIKTGQAPAPIGERIANEFIQKHQYEPKSETAKAINQFVSELPEKITGSSMGVGPLPELMALGTTPKEAVTAKTESAVSKLGKAAETVKNAPETVKTALNERFPTMESEMQGKFAQKKAEQTSAPVEEKTVAPSTVGQEFNPEEGFKEHNFGEKTFPKEEQQSRLEVLNRTSPDLKVDPNVIEGRGKDRATDYAVSNTDTPEGHLLHQQFEKEKRAQIEYGNKLIDETGGSRGLDESANYKRGSIQLKPFEGLAEVLDNNIKELYKKRDEEAVHVPVVADEVQKILNTKSEVLANSETKAHAEGATERLKELGIMDKDGNLLPANALQAEKFRQYLNDKWTPQNATLNKALKEAVDNDVFANAPEGIHNDARALYQYRKETLDNPKGIASILDSSGPNGINRKVPIERIADTIANLPVDQFDHVIKTLRSVPEELQAAAQAAEGEIKAHFLNKVEVAYAKSANAGTKYLNENREVFNRLFSPEEMAKINDRNSMAHILKTDTGYKGSAVQQTNLAKRGIGRKLFEQGVKKGGAVLAETALGGTTGGLAAIGTHELLGNYFAGKALKAEEAAQVQRALKKQAGFTNLGDIGKKE